MRYLLLIPILLFSQPVMAGIDVQRYDSNGVYVHFTDGSFIQFDNARIEEEAEKSAGTVEFRKSASDFLALEIGKIIGPKGFKPGQVYIDYLGSPQTFTIFDYIVPNLSLPQDILSKPAIVVTPDIEAIP